MLMGGHFRSGEEFAHAPDGGREPRKHYLPAEITAMRMLVFMVNNEGDGPFTVYRLMRFEPGKWQRRDRIRTMLGRLAENGWVEAIPGDPPRYRVTEEGRRICPIMVQALDLMRMARPGPRQLSSP
jgi:hypothetical protein